MKTMLSRNQTILMVVVFAARAIYTVTVVLSPPLVDVIENSNVTLTCKVMNSSEEVYTTGWRENPAGSPVGYIVLYPNGMCSATGHLNNVSLFAWSCERNSIFTLTLKDINRYEHRKEWVCLGSYQFSNASQILVRVPVESVEMKPHTKENISIHENTSTTFECITTTSRPIPAVFWFMSKPNHLDIINVTTEARQSPQAGENISFAAVTSVLNHSFTRRFNGWSLHCNATNMPDQYVTSGQKLLDIMYPPDGFPELIGSDNIRTYRIVEHQVGKLSCIINSGNPLPTLTWSCFKGNVSVSSGNDSVSSTLTWTALRVQNDNPCVCVSDHAFGKKNVSTIVKVLYPPDKPTIQIHSKNVSNVIEIIENNSLNITCVSKSYPNSDYTWIRGATILETGQSVKINSVQQNHTGGYTCEVNNTMIGSDRLVREGRNRTKISLQLLFPPRLPTLLFIDNKTDKPINETSIDVIKGDIFTLLCQTEGRPSPEYIWEDGSIGNTSVINASQSLSKACTATNFMTETNGEYKNGSASASVAVTVLYSPTIPQMYIYNRSAVKHKIQESVRVIENVSFNLICLSDSKPNPQYKWYLNKSKMSSQQELVKLDINRQQRGIYRCQASNTMVRTFGDKHHGTSNTNTTIDVLYPAEVSNLTGETRIEGSSINVTCPVISGNPPTYTAEWKHRDSEISNSQVLYISNISRTDEDIYVCSVTTKMRPTYGGSIDHVNEGQFRLTVVYKAYVMKFYIDKKIDENFFTVNESEDVTFFCYIDSKPSPDATIHYHGKIVHASSNNSLVYTNKNIQCTDFGLYICSGKNQFNNGKPSEKRLTLYVNCSPRPSPSIEHRNEVKSARNVPATLSFTALAYPWPGQSGFIWIYINGSDVIPLFNNNKTAISSSNLQSNLTIKNVSQADYGHYMLNIKNSIGVYNQTFVIEPYDVPMPPVIHNWTASETAITITIKAGSDGGLFQSFYLKYKKTTQTNWIHVYINEPTSGVFNHTVSGLSSSTTYDVIIYARNKLGNSTEETTLVKTKEFIAIPSKVEPPYNIGLITGTVTGVAIVIIGITVVGIFLYRKRASDDTGKLIYQNVPFSGKMLKKKNEKRKTDETPMEDLQEVDDVPAFEHEPTEYYNNVEKIDMIDRLKVSELFSYLLANDDDSFGTAYQKLPTGLEKPCTFARKPENIALNRYNGIYPYDHSRVKIQGHPDFFINACYIDGYRRPKSYIASLGPTGKTTNGFETFWQMVWHEKTDIIVMLTNLQEPSGMKCERYWPKEGTSEQYGNVCVSIQKLEVFAEYTVKTLNISKEEVNRTVTHLHYTAWPDKKVPEDATSLLEFRQRVKSTLTCSEGPIIVHCSAGIGRTGTLIALDRLIEEGNREGSVNVAACVYSMREQRVKMVQTLEQYIYIYKALVNAFDLDCEAISVDSFKEYVDTTNSNVYSRQFQHMKQSLEIEGKEDLEASTGNEIITRKNRIEADIPARRFRVLLYTNEAGEDSEYINAVYMHSFKTKEYFIIAQSPLPNTVADFICMIYQEDCTCIVTMEDLTEPGMTVGVYLPSDKHTLKFGTFTVSCTVLETKHHCIVRKVKIKNGSREKALYHFQYTKWMTGHDTPANPKDFVRFVIEVEEYASQFFEERSHVLVHCLKANERSGLFCAVTTVLEKLKYERQVSVLNTLKHLRTRRRSIITSMEQLKFCYQAASAYIQMYNP